MAKAKKLPSGSWRCLVYSHNEPVFDDSGKPVLGPDGKQKQRRIYESFTSNIPGPAGKRDAEKKAADYAANKEHTKCRTNLTLGQALDEYIANRSSVLSPGTIREYKRSRARDLQELMDIKLENITQETIQAAINKEALTHSPKTIRNMHGLLSAAFRTYRPGFALTTTLPKRRPAKIEVPIDSNIKKLMEYLRDNEMEIPVLLAAFGPMRRSEICALEYEDIKGNIIHVSKALVEDENRKWVLKDTKSYSSDRFIEYPEQVIQRIGTGTGRIVTINPNAISSRFSHILKNSGIPKFRFHDLRHYSASIMHAIGVPDVYIMARGGWSTDSTLKNVYRHTMSDRMEQMNQKANDHFKDLMQHEMQHNEENSL